MNHFVGGWCSWILHLLFFFYAIKQKNDKDMHVASIGVKDAWFLKSWWLSLLLWRFCMKLWVEHTLKMLMSKWSSITVLSSNSIIILVSFFKELCMCFFVVDRSLWGYNWMATLKLLVSTLNQLVQNMQQFFNEEILKLMAIAIVWCNKSIVANFGTLRGLHWKPHKAIASRLQFHSQQHIHNPNNHSTGHMYVFELYLDCLLSDLLVCMQFEVVNVVVVTLFNSCSSSSNVMFFVELWFGCKLWLLWLDGFANEVSQF
jgi:hypothetical protein